MQHLARLAAVAAFVLLGILPTLASAQPAGPEPPGAPRPIAQVDGRVITDADVQRKLKETYGKRPIAENAQAAVELAALEQLVAQEIALSALIARGEAASEAEVQSAFDGFREQLTKQQIPVDTFLKNQRHTEASLKDSIRWQTSWKRYLAKNTTGKLESYFEQHRPHFDGSQVRAAHLLLKIPGGGSAAETVTRARSLKQQIDSGKLTFAAAVQQYSDGTKDNGGDLGFLPRRDVMPESFSRAAFELQPGEISEPVVTPFGVHLIQCREIKPGEGTWKQAEKELRQAVALELFADLVAAQRPQAKIQYLDSRYTPRSDK